MFKSMKNLKRKIEEEIEKINNSQEKIEEEITLSFKKKHLELEEKEKKLRLELNTKVNNIKEELEDYLKKTNNMLLSLNKTQELIQNNENKNNEIKTLYYISEINKGEETAKDFLKKKIKNLNISIYLDNSEIFYENYYFNGIPIPKYVKVEEKEKKLYISWNIDDSMIKDIDAKNIKYSVSIKDNNNSELKFESLNKYFYYNYYNEDNEYEIKVRTEIDYCYSDWSEVIKFKREKQVKNEDNKFTLNLFEIKKEENKESKPIFNLFSKDNEVGLFGSSNNNQKQVHFSNSLFDSARKNEEISLFGVNKNLFSSSINENKGSTLFGSKNNNTGLFGKNQNEFLFKNNDNKSNPFFINKDINKEIKQDDKKDNDI